ncbi:hypothetical protein [Paratractidigestivibacter sp.]|uniref:hypothetical protein n=1 Tax=Paratractidigestivibacter sp. TaxID=2847316 RepID=UPI002AC8CB86|nr:hypothetical protein [Paratractidigestivibacter sp.]
MGGRGASSANLSHQGKNGGSGKAHGEPLLDKIPAIEKRIRQYPKTAEGDSEAISQIEAVKAGKATVRIYRAAPASSINTRDWVFLSRERAEKWQKSPFTGRILTGANGKPFAVLPSEVPVSSVHWTGKNLEFAYVGKSKNGGTG